MTRPVGETDLAVVAARLYLLPLEKFTAARNQQAKELAGGGDKGLAEGVKRLPKPSTAAWLVNMLVARRPQLVDEAIALGESLRKAQANLDPKRLKELGRQRQQLLTSIAKESREMAEDLGHGVGSAVVDEVERTFWAAIADVGAAAAVSSGRLVRSLTASGWDAVDVAGAVGGPFESQPAGAGQVEVEQDSGSDTKQLLDDARAGLEDAWERADRADDEMESARRRLDRLGSRRGRLVAEVEDLESRVRELKRDIKTVDGEISSAEEASARAAEAAREAQEERDRVQRTVDELSRPK